VNIYDFIPTVSARDFLEKQHEGPNNRPNFVKGYANGSLTHFPGRQSWQSGSYRA
jgi:hypothetical protein